MRGICSPAEGGGVEGSCSCGVAYAWMALPAVSVAVALAGEAGAAWMGFVSILEARRGSVVAILEAGRVVPRGIDCS